MVMGIIAPALFLSSMFIFPSKIGSVNVVVIIVSTGTFTAFLAGLPAAGVGTNNFLHSLSGEWAAVECYGVST